MAFTTLFYYNIIVAWTLVYAWQSLRSPPNHVPWGESENRVDAERFWEHSVLKQSSGFEEFGHSIGSSQLIFASILAWLVLYLATRHGVQSTGKVAYVTATAPYILLALLVVRGITLEGAAEGLKFYLKPKPKILFQSTRPWLDAANQIVYSLGVGTGQLVAFGSYNTPNEDVVFDSVAIALLNSFTSLFAGIAIFSMLGHKAKRDGVRVSDVVDSGEGLAFVAYPDGLSALPGAGIWCFIFFITLFSLALDSSMALLEAWITMLADLGIFNDTKTAQLNHNYREFGVFSSCLFGFFVSLIFITRPGIYWFSLVDSVVVWGVFAVAVAECYGVARIFGAKRFAEQLHRMAGRRVPNLILYCWSTITPIVCFFLGLISLGITLARKNPKYEGARATILARLVSLLLMLGPLIIITFGIIYPDADWKRIFTCNFCSNTNKDTDSISSQAWTAATSKELESSTIRSTTNRNNPSSAPAATIIVDAPATLIPTSSSSSSSSSISSPANIELSHFPNSVHHRVQNNDNSPLTADGDYHNDEARRLATGSTDDDIVVQRPHHSNLV
eukprot:CAMPEP_0197316040 /NCGR_PEP_ID=MMETSP0891-20130614/40644_1 /TAXON_ID=44058 ORGANISM="Aureoumbra lagunensis, Strain CCMP1510" /NCGR_SAMPLE_ID=MMETSP0891 /ASSEMBLY_ACC=CAM_ASM_000534 /LENGTH=559 /DNA_ID=CAMNT_0042805309 /DNA_START=355 /DNA_END=2034 /DNA_ORIENTATION=-